MLQATHEAVADTTRALRTVAPQRQLKPTAKTTKPKRITPPEPEGEEPVVIPTNPGLFEPIPEIEQEVPEPDFTEVQAADPVPPDLDEVEENEDEPTDAEVEDATRHIEVGEGDLTPQGRYRSHITDDPDFSWRIPAPKLLHRSTAAERVRPSSPAFDDE